MQQLILRLQQLVPRPLIRLDATSIYTHIVLNHHLYKHCHLNQQIVNHFSHDLIPTPVKHVHSFHHWLAIQSATSTGLSLDWFARCTRSTLHIIPNSCGETISHPTISDHNNKNIPLHCTPQCASQELLSSNDQQIHDRCSEGIAAPVPLLLTDHCQSGFRRQIRRLCIGRVCDSYSKTAGPSRCVLPTATATLRRALITVEQHIITASGLTPWTTATPDDYTDVSLPPAWCSFEGVTCGTIPTAEDYRRVTTIELQYPLDLDGTLPVISNLGEVTKLQVSLALSTLPCTIPPSISVMSKLRILTVNIGRLTGTIPSSLGSLVQLEELYLSNGNLSGSIPSSLGSLSKLRRLLFPDNQLSGSIPSSFGLLTSLEYMQLLQNKLTGPIPSSLGNLAKLESMEIQFNKLTGSLPSSLACLSNLKELVLFVNQLSGSIPSSVGLLTNLIRLQLTQNKLGGTIPSSLNNLVQLKGLYLNDNQLIGTIPLLNQPSLISFTAGTNYLTMGSLSEIPSSTFGENLLGNYLSLGTNCLKFTHPYVPEYYSVDVDAIRCLGEQDTNILYSPIR